MHKDWLDNEYREWVEALAVSNVEDFKLNPKVKRMLGEVEPSLYPIYLNTGLSVPIDNIGGTIRGQRERFVHYAKMVQRQKPNSIVEIGGGCGQFYATLRGLGYKGDYFIYDLPEVQKFQRKYLDEVTRVTGLNTELKETQFDFCVSLYCLGELDDETKEYYIENVVKKCPHGLVVWNPHSGASDNITWKCKIEPEYPSTGENNKLLTW